MYSKLWIEVLREEDWCPILPGFLINPEFVSVKTCTWSSGQFKSICREEFSTKFRFVPWIANQDWVSSSPSLLKNPAIGGAEHRRWPAFQAREGGGSKQMSRRAKQRAILGTSLSYRTIQRKTPLHLCARRSIFAAFAVPARNSTENRAKLERPGFPRISRPQPTCWS